MSQPSVNRSQVKNILQPDYYIVHLGSVDGMTKAFVTFESQEGRRKAQDIT